MVICYHQVRSQGGRELLGHESLELVLDHARAFVVRRRAIVILFTVVHHQRKVVFELFPRDIVPVRESLVHLFEIHRLLDDRVVIRHQRAIHGALERPRVLDVPDRLEHSAQFRKELHSLVVDDGDTGRAGVAAASCSSISRAIVHSRRLLRTHPTCSKNAWDLLNLVLAFAVVEEEARVDRVCVGDLLDALVHGLTLGRQHTHHVQVVHLNHMMKQREGERKEGGVRG